MEFSKSAPRIRRAVLPPLCVRSVSIGGAMSVLEDSLGEEPTNDSVLRQLDISIQAERDPVKRASLFERQNAHLKRTLDAQKQRLHDLKEKELDLASSDLNRLQERMEQLAAENKVRMHLA